jgi:hypothetical protein
MRERCFCQLLTVACWLVAAGGHLDASPPDGEATPAGEGAVAASGQRSAEAVPTTTASGMRVFLDPVTGEPTSTPSHKQRERLLAPSDTHFSRSAAGVDQAPPGLRTFPLAPGGRGVFLAGRFQTATEVRLKPDGSYETVCVGPITGDHPPHPHPAALEADRPESPPEQ